MHRVEEQLGHDEVLFYPAINVRSYEYMKGLLSGSNQDFFENPRIQFPVQVRVAGFLENLARDTIGFAKLFAQTAVSGLVAGIHPHYERKKKSYLCGIAVAAPGRQLRGNQRGPDFIIDNERIRPEEVVYFPLVDLTTDQEGVLAKIPGAVFYPPRRGRFFSHFSEWAGLLWLALKKNFLRNGEEVLAACAALFTYFSWVRLLETVRVRHFITHCDFGVAHIGRNFALEQVGIQTWYFTDSMSLGCNRRIEDGECRMRHPFWTYLHYDHFVTWDKFIAEYFISHPGSIKKSHIVGCLWGGHIEDANHARRRKSIPDLEKVGDRFLLAAFDTTYSRNAVSSYAEGLAFAKHLIQLADAWADVLIIFKEKKDRAIHCLLDPILGPKLVEMYEKMKSHPRIRVYSNKKADASELISLSDMVVSFPFTSTTFETLSVNRPAIWHDPLGYYKDTPYGKVGGVTTHGYDELKARVLEIKLMKPSDYQNPIPMNSPLMDLYRDGRAIDRFRDLLVSQ